MKRPWYRFLYVRSPLAKLIFSILGLLVAVAVVLFQGITEEMRMVAQTNNWDGRSVQNGAALFANNCASCHGADGKGLPGVAPALNSRYFFTQRLTDLQFTGSLEDYVALTVAAGRPNNKNSQWAQMMPTWSSEYGGPFRGDQVRDVAAFVVNWEEEALAQTQETDPWQPFLNAPTVDIYGDGAAIVQEATPEPTGPRPPQELFVSMTCVACHNLNAPQDAQNRGPVGPNMGNIHETAATKVAGEDAPTYVYNSITNPNAFVNETYTAGIMPQNFTEKMSEEEIQSLVEWILDPNRPQ